MRKNLYTRELLWEKPGYKRIFNTSSLDFLRGIIFFITNTELGRTEFDIAFLTRTDLRRAGMATRAGVISFVIFIIQFFHLNLAFATIFHQMRTFVLHV